MTLPPILICPICTRAKGDLEEMTLSHFTEEYHVVEVELLDEFGYSHGFQDESHLASVAVYTCDAGHEKTVVRPKGYTRRIKTYNPARDEL